MLSTSLPPTHTNDPATRPLSPRQVALLTRSIRVVGIADSPGVGCHSIFYQGFAAVRVEGVEFADCGQDAPGRYPVHFHMAGQVPPGTYIRAASVHDSRFRAVTLHGTQGVTVERTVAVDVQGHAFFFEDGAEWGNTLQGNLGMLGVWRSLSMRTLALPATSLSLLSRECRQR